MGVTMKVFVDTSGFCFIVNALNKSIIFDSGTHIDASLKKTRKYKYEVQVPIQVIGNFLKKNMTTVNINYLQ